MYLRAKKCGSVLLMPSALVYKMEVKGCRGRKRISVLPVKWGMGTVLQCSPNFFTTLPRSHGSTVTVDTPDTRASSKDRPLKDSTRTSCSVTDPLQQPMESIQCHKESLRQTMLEHEKIFKEQVRELHRVYRTQKQLMSQLQNREPKLHPLAYTIPGATAQPCAGLRSCASSSGALTASSSPSASNRHRHSAQPNTSEHSPYLGHRTKASLGSQEPAICSQEHLRAANGDGFEHQQPPAEGGAPTSNATRAQVHTLSMETPSNSCSDEECDLELTLSIGCGGSKKRTGRPKSSPHSTGHRTSSSTPARSDRPGGARGGPFCLRGGVRQAEGEPAAVGMAFPGS